MSEQEKYDSRDLTALLADLPKEDQRMVRGVIAGLKLARTPFEPDPKKEPART